MTRFLLPLLAASLWLAGCSGERAGADRVLLVAPTPDGAVEARRCDDGGAGGVLINGICV